MFVSTKNQTEESNKWVTYATISSWYRISLDFDHISGSSHCDTHRGLNERGRQSGRAEQQNSKHLKILRDSSTGWGSASAAFALLTQLHQF